ncbi:MAG: hypothetical protein P1U56_13380 [Saprospiraceae bacterium]|nr:hypothetical protein [Saprospiraceae bacterium]
MKVAIINSYKEKFKAFLSQQSVPENSFYFEIIDNWKKHWNLEGKNLSTIYDSSLQSKTSARLWGGSVNSPKSIIKVLLENEEEFMRATLRDLFNESLDLGLRLDRFGYHTDQVFRPIQSKKPKYVSHFHHDREILCLYLALEYPSQYCLFDYPTFFKMMTIFESRNIPTKTETERYYKSCRGIKNLLVKDEEFVSLFKQAYHLKEEDQIGLMLMSIFMEFVSESAA